MLIYCYLFIFWKMLLICFSTLKNIKLYLEKFLFISILFNDLSEIFQIKFFVLAKIFISAKLEILSLRIVYIVVKFFLIIIKN